MLSTILLLAVLVLMIFENGKITNKIRGGGTANILTAEEYGFISLILNYVPFILLFTKFGFEGGLNRYIPYWLAKLAGAFLEKWWKLTKKKTRPLLTKYTVINLGSRLNFSIEKAKRELGWVPKISYKEGMPQSSTN